MNTFPEFIKEFNSKVSLLVQNKNNVGLNLSDTNDEINEMLALSQSVFPGEVKSMLETLGVTGFITKVREDLERQEKDIIHYLVIPETRLVDVNFKGKNIVGKTVDLRKVLRDLKIDKDNVFFYFISSFLAQDDYYDYIQVYYALKT